MHNRQVNVRWKEREKRRIEAIVGKMEESGEKVSGYIRVAGVEPWMEEKDLSQRHEVLVVTENKILVEGISEHRTGMSKWGVMLAMLYSFPITKPDIIEVELTKLGREIRINVRTSKKEYKWHAKGLIPEKRGVRLEDYEKILRRVFPCKLSVRKRGIRS